MNKDVEQHLQELIDFYSKTEINDIDYLKKLFVRNLKDVQRRYVKYDKSRKIKVEEFILKNWITYDSSKNFTEFNEYMEIPIKEIKELLELNGSKEWILITY